MNQPSQTPLAPMPEHSLGFPEVAQQPEAGLPYRRNPEELAKLVLDTQSDQAQEPVQDLLRTPTPQNYESSRSPEVASQQPSSKEVAATAEAIAMQIISARVPEINQDMQQLKRGGYGLAA